MSGNRDLLLLLLLLLLRRLKLLAIQKASQKTSSESCLATRQPSDRVPQNQQKQTVLVNRVLVRNFRPICLVTRSPYTPFQIRRTTQPAVSACCSRQSRAPVKNPNLPHAINFPLESTTSTRSPAIGSPSTREIAPP